MIRRCFGQGRVRRPAAKSKVRGLQGPERKTTRIDSQSHRHDAKAPLQLIPEAAVFQGSVCVCVRVSAWSLEPAFSEAAESDKPMT